MTVLRLRLHDFRNVADEVIELDERFTVLAGENGAGKTNVLEALWFVGTLRSFRVGELAPLVRDGCPAAMVEVEADDPEAGIPTRLRVQLQRQGPRVSRAATVDGKLVRAAADFYGRLRAILFTPEDLAVLRDGPSARRQLVDRALFARERAHIRDVQEYEKLLRSRNRVLRGEGPRVGPVERAAWLDSYESGLADVGARIWSRREALIDLLHVPFQQAFLRVHGPSLHADVRYEPGSPTATGDRAEVLRRALADNRPRDEVRGVTTVGPHRDDVRFELGEHAAAEFASQGQCRALVLAFKLAELQSASDAVGRVPLLLLDDVSSELDPERCRQLVEVLRDRAGQCILTTTAADFVPLPEDAKRRVYAVHRGRFERVSRPS